MVHMTGNDQKNDNTEIYCHDKRQKRMWSFFHFADTIVKVNVYNFSYNIIVGTPSIENVNPNCGHPDDHYLLNKNHA